MSSKVRTPTISSRPIVWMGFTLIAALVPLALVFRLTLFEAKHFQANSIMGDVQTQGKALERILLSVSESATLLSNNTIMDGILRAYGNEGTDPLTGATLAQWQQSFNDVATYYLSMKPYLSRIEVVHASGLLLAQASQAHGEISTASPEFLASSPQKGLVDERLLEKTFAEQSPPVEPQFVPQISQGDRHYVQWSSFVEDRLENVGDRAVVVMSIDWPTLLNEAVKSRPSYDRGLEQVKIAGGAAIFERGVDDLHWGLPGAKATAHNDHNSHDTHAAAEPHDSHDTHAAAEPHDSHDTHAAAEPHDSHDTHAAAASNDHGATHSQPVAVGWHEQGKDYLFTVDKLKTTVAANQLELAYEYRLPKSILTSMILKAHLHWLAFLPLFLIAVLAVAYRMSRVPTGAKAPIDAQGATNLPVAHPRLAERLRYLNTEMNSILEDWRSALGNPTQRNSNARGTSKPETDILLKFNISGQDASEVPEKPIELDAHLASLNELATTAASLTLSDDEVKNKTYAERIANLANQLRTYLKTEQSSTGNTSVPMEVKQLEIIDEWTRKFNNLLEQAKIKENFERPEPELISDEQHKKAA